MSWYIANENGIIDQFASGQGMEDLRIAVDLGHYPALKDFIDKGVTVNILLCILQLGKLRKMTLHESVKDTAKGLQNILRGQTLVSITQGMTGFDSDTEDAPKVKESAVVSQASTARSLPRSLQHPDFTKLIDPIKKRVKRIVARYFSRQEAAILDDVRLRFHVGKEIREASDDRTPGEKRAAELLPDSLSPLNFAATSSEDDAYIAEITRTIERAQKQMARELGSQTYIPETAVSKYLNENSLSKLTGDFSDFTKTRLRSAIAEAVDAGGTADDIVSAIQDTMEDFSTRRAELVAQTEINQAFNWSRNEMADANGMTHKMWVVESLNPCLICIANMTEGWIEFGDEFVSGDDYAPAHPACQCACDYQLTTAGEGL